MTGGAQLVLLDIDYEMIHHHNLEHMVYQEDQVWEFVAHFRLQIQMVCLVDLFFLKRRNVTVIWASFNKFIVV